MLLISVIEVRICLHATNANNARRNAVKLAWEKQKLTCLVHVSLPGERIVECVGMLGHHVFHCVVDWNHLCTNTKRERFASKLSMYGFPADWCRLIAVLPNPKTRQALCCTNNKNERVPLCSARLRIDWELASMFEHSTRSIIFLHHVHIGFQKE